MVDAHHAQRGDVEAERPATANDDQRLAEQRDDVAQRHASSSASRDDGP